MLLLLVF